MSARNDRLVSNRINLTVSIFVAGITVVLVLMLFLSACGPGGSARSEAEEDVADALEDFFDALADQDFDDLEDVATEDFTGIQQTLENIKRVGQCVARYYVDHPRIGPPRTGDIEELQRIFMETEININREIFKDGWGNLLIYRPGSGRLDKSYSVISFGADGREDERVAEDRVVFDPNDDIVWSNGVYASMQQYGRFWFGHADVEVENIDIDDDKAKGTLVIEHAGMKWEMTAELEEDDDEWKVAELGALEFKGQKSKVEKAVLRACREFLEESDGTVIEIRRVPSQYPRRGSYRLRSNLSSEEKALLKWAEEGEEDEKVSFTNSYMDGAEVYLRERRGTEWTAWALTLLLAREWMVDDHYYLESEDVRPGDEEAGEESSREERRERDEDIQELDLDFSPEAMDELQFEDMPEDPPGPVLVTGNMTPPKYIPKGRLQYPRKAQILRRSGVVVLSVIVTKEGQLEDIKVLRENPSDFGFGPAAIQYLKQCEWQPALQNGKPIYARYNITFQFKLQ